MVKYETFNLCYMGSIPIGLKRLSINGRSTVFQTDDVGSNPTSRIIHRVIILIGKELSCHERLCRFESGMTRILYI
jgi:hypothetical protein